MGLRFMCGWVARCRTHAATLGSVTVCDRYPHSRHQALRAPVDGLSSFRLLLYLSHQPPSPPAPAISFSCLSACELRPCMNPAQTQHHFNRRR
ncbi:hypothetical protein C2E23DRAFT_550565 [Lenzites betulinus]|nr:hypothetical protein C2E23DRAFT_550565 [Lenzites betulinus]